MTEKAKILLFDIESTGLEADFGTLLCFGYKWLDEPVVRVPAISDFLPLCGECGKWKDTGNDKPLLREIHKILSSAGMWVTYFGKGFDVKFINAKLLEHDLPLLPNIPHVDVYFTARENLALSRKSLDNVSRHIGTVQKKTKVDGRIWNRARTGDPKALKYIIEHCRQDVLVLEETYLKLRPLVRTHPRISGFGPCRYCGAEKFQKRGVILTALKNEKQRIYCKGCGGWDSRPL